MLRIVLVSLMLLGMGFAHTGATSPTPTPSIVVTPTVVGVIPHYATGAEWTSTLYLQVGGGNCDYGIKFMKPNGELWHVKMFTATSIEPWQTVAFKYQVPASPTLQHGPVIIETVQTPLVIDPAVPITYMSSFKEKRSCYVESGEIVFTANYPGQQYDGSSRLKKTIFSYPEIILDSAFQYGVALYNHSDALVSFGYLLIDAATGSTIRLGELTKLNPREQKIFVINDQIPEMKEKMVIMQFLSIPTIEVYSTILKFNLLRGFSTVEVY